MKLKIAAAALALLCLGACQKKDSDDTSPLIDKPGEEQPHVHLFVSSDVAPTCRKCGYAVYTCSFLKKVAVSDTVTTIGARAFYNCVGLEEITLSSTVTAIGKDAFDGCTALTTVNFYGTKEQFQELFHSTSLPGGVLVNYK